MRLGLLSDSHGRVEITRRAVEALASRSCNLLIHLGDIGDEAVIDELIGHDARIVFGNCDWNIQGLTRHAECMGIKVEHPMGLVTIDGKRIAFTHGHLAHLVTQGLSQGVEYLLHGHTHELRDQRVGVTRIINPGALHRAARYTAAVLDPAEDSLEILEVSKR